MHGNLCCFQFQSPFLNQVAAGLMENVQASKPVLMDCAKTRVYGLSLVLQMPTALFMMTFL